MADKQVELNIPDELVTQLKHHLEAAKENTSSVKETVSAALKEIMTEENSGSELMSDEDSTKLVDFIVKTMWNHAIKRVGKHTFCAENRSNSMWANVRIAHKNKRKYNNCTPIVPGHKIWDHNSRSYAEVVAE